MARKKRTQKRATMQEIEEMPALITTDQLASIIGVTPIYAANMCRSGPFAECAVKVGVAWMVNKAKALEVVGLA